MQTIVRSQAPLLAGASGYKSVKSVSSVVHLGVTGVQEFRSADNSPFAGSPSCRN